MNHPITKTNRAQQQLHTIPVVHYPRVPITMPYIYARATPKKNHPVEAHATLPILVLFIIPLVIGILVSPHFQTGIIVHASDPTNAVGSIHVGPIYGCITIKQQSVARTLGIED